MYLQDDFDRTLVAQRVEDFRDQVARRLSGQLSEDEFKPLRLMNGLYLQLHAYMLRVAIPYGTLSSAQLRALAALSRRFDRGYGHFTTRQNIQFHWMKLAEVPDALAHLAEAGLHAIQTSGNCVRNITTDQWAGVAEGEVDDPRVWAEILRQHTTLHPEFSFLPRKFKIAVIACLEDRAALRVHDIGLRLLRDDKGALGFEVMVGGGLGRTPFLAQTIRPFLPAHDVVSYVEAVLRVYNQFGRRDNIYKARIKILVHDLGAEAFAREVETEWSAVRASLALEPSMVDEIRSRFLYPAYLALEDEPVAWDGEPAEKARFEAWQANAVHPHRIPGYAVVAVSLKPEGGVPGDATADEMESLAQIAGRFSFGEIRVGHDQNLVLPHVARRDLPKVWDALDRAGLSAPNVGLASDIIACPGLDYCSLANARSLPIAQELSRRLRRLERENGLGPFHVNISGCINACGQHHVGHVGILGVEKNGEEYYQVTIGGRADEQAALGALLGPAVARADIVQVVEQLAVAYLDLRRGVHELFPDTVRRVGIAAIRERLDAAH